MILLVAKVVYLLTFNEPNFRDKLVNLEDFKKAILKLILKIGITKDRKGEINYFMRKSILWKNMTKICMMMMMYHQKNLFVNQSVHPSVFSSSNFWFCSISFFCSSYYYRLCILYSSFISFSFISSIYS